MPSLTQHVKSLCRPLFSRAPLTASVLTLLLITGCSSGKSEPAGDPLPQPASLQGNSATVSGFSSGGYMANQLHLAHPELFTGAAVFSAGPWGCAIKGLSHAMMSCMQTRMPLISQQERMAMLHKASRSGAIGDPALLVDDPVYIFIAREDSVVAPVVSESLVSFYQQLVADYNLSITLQPEAGHGFPTLYTDAPCGSPSETHLQNCGLDGAGEALTRLYGVLQPPGEAKGRLQTFSQDTFFEGRGMLDQGFIYIPESCNAADADCQLHVVLHGCEQSSESIGEDFIRNSGYLQRADSNDLVLLFPQAKSSFSNPKGCWDWWGYEKEPFFSRNNAQISAIADMIRHLTQPPAR